MEKSEILYVLKKSSRNFQFNWRNVRRETL